MKDVSVIVRYCNSWPEASEDAALRHRFLFGVRGESLGCVDGYLPSKFGHEAACANKCAGRRVLHTGCGGRIISAHTPIELFHLHMYDGTINLSPEFDVVLAGPYPEAAGHTTMTRAATPRATSSMAATPTPSTRHPWQTEVGWK